MKYAAERRHRSTDYPQKQADGACALRSAFRLANILNIRKMWLGAESNRRHEDFQSSALPTELPSQYAHTEHLASTWQEAICAFTRPVVRSLRARAQNGQRSLWAKGSVPNLFRYAPSGVYYARFRCRGKEIKRSLKTNRVSVARLRLMDVLKGERSGSRRCAHRVPASHCEVSGGCSCGEPGKMGLSHQHPIRNRRTNMHSKATTRARNLEDQ
jgi:hypothetical protein